MSQADDDAGLLGDELAGLVEIGRISDLDALAYLGGDLAARRKVERVMKETAGVYGHKSQDAIDEGL